MTALFISDLVDRIFAIYWFMLLVRIIISWIPLPSHPILDQIIRILYDLTEPYLGIFRRILPMATFGGMGIDFSPIIGFFVLGIVREVVVGALIQAGV